MISGAIRNPGFYKFSNDLPVYEQITSDKDKFSIDYQGMKRASNLLEVSIEDRFLTRVSDLILKSGGLVKKSDISLILKNNTKVLNKTIKLKPKKQKSVQLAGNWIYLMTCRFHSPR